MRSTLQTVCVRSVILTWVLVAIVLPGCEASHPRSPGELVRHGGMHETIGQRQHHGRVELDQVVRKPHFYGVGALEGLEGEITIADSVAVATAVASDGRPQPLAPAGLKAALLVGQSVHEWTNIPVGQDVAYGQFDNFIAKAASHHGLDPNRPFMFVIDGEFMDVRLHVINGACPLHARMHKLDLLPELRPFELEARTVKGTLVGVYAADSVGKLTHPDTSVHVHLVYEDPQTGHRLTGHLERIGVAGGAILKIPAESH